MAIRPSGRGPELIAVYAFFCALTTVTVCLRTYCRAVLLKNWALDDYFAVTSWVLFVILCSFAITGAHHGSGQHTADIRPPSEVLIGLKWWWRCEPVYVLSNMAIKASIAVMLLRLTIVKVQRIIIWITIIITELYSAFFFFLFIFQCRPSSYFWTQFNGGKGSCINPMTTVHITYVYSALICVGDWILAIIPFFMVWNLQMKPRTKVVVAMILALGAIASTATIVRIPYLVSLSNKADFLYATTDVAIWSACETGLAITAASAATLRPIFQTCLSRNKLFGNTTVAAYRPQAPQRCSLWPRPQLCQPRQNAGYIRSASGASAGIGAGPVNVYGIRSSQTEDKPTRSATATTELVDEERAVGFEQTFLDSRESTQSDRRMIGTRRDHVVNMMRRP